MISKNITHHLEKYLVGMSIQVTVPFSYEKYLEELMDLVETKEVPLSRIDDAVERILRVKCVSMLFEHPYSNRSLLDTIGCKLHGELAREAVCKSFTTENWERPKKAVSASG